MRTFILSRLKSFAHAFAGLFYFFKSQVHARIHLLAAIVVVALGFYFGVNRLEWVILLICIALVITLEIMNTAIEKLSDRLTKEFDKDIKRIKDMAAAAVLVASIASLIIALIIFIPYFAA